MTEYDSLPQPQRLEIWENGVLKLMINREKFEAWLEAKGTETCGTHSRCPLEVFSDRDGTIPGASWMWAFVGAIDKARDATHDIGWARIRADQALAILRAIP